MFGKRRREREAQRDALAVELQARLFEPFRFYRVWCSDVGYYDARSRPTVDNFITTADGVLVELRCPVRIEEIKVTEAREAPLWTLIAMNTDYGDVYVRATPPWAERITH